MIFSIIVPIYNVEKYLSECIESILSQNYDDMEIILVDDGSTDGSGKIADSYEMSNSKIRVIHRLNGGLSAARNTGLDLAQGDYIIFLDSDDYLAEDSLRLIEKEIQINYPDIIAGYGLRFSEKTGIEEGMRFRIGIDNPMNGKQFYKIALYQNRLTVGAPYYIYNRKYLENHNFRFKEGLLHEDEYWNPIVLYYAQKVIDFKFRYYCYRFDNINSITRDASKWERRALDRKSIAEMLSIYFDNMKEKEAYAFHDNISAQYMYAVYSGDLIQGHNILRSFPIREARTLKYKMKSLLFLFSPRIACALRRLK